MSNKYPTLASLFSDIANAIRERTGNSSPIVADEFPVKITSIADKTVLLSLIDGSITSITISSEVTYLSKSAFLGCMDLTEINVPWSEGQVEGAPWGALKATINYNYVGG